MGNTDMLDIKKISKLIIISYTHHVREEVARGNMAYKTLGIDKNIRLYRGLFEAVIFSLLKVNRKPELIFSPFVVNSCVKHIKGELEANGLYKAVSNKFVSEAIALTCMKIMSSSLESDISKWLKG